MSNVSAFMWYLSQYKGHNIIDMQGFTSPPSFGKNPRWPTKIAKNEHFRSGFRNGNNQNYFLDTFRIPNMYVKKIRSPGVGWVTFLLNYIILFITFSLKIEFQDHFTYINFEDIMHMYDHLQKTEKDYLQASEKRAPSLNKHTLWLVLLLTLWLFEYEFSLFSMLGVC